jgi:hypothetical protein
LCECNSFVCWWRKLSFCLKSFLPTQCHGLLMFSLSISLPMLDRSDEHIWRNSCDSS